MDDRPKGKLRHARFVRITRWLTTIASLARGEDGELPFRPGHSVTTLRTSCRTLLHRSRTTLVLLLSASAVHAQDANFPDSASTTIERAALADIEQLRIPGIAVAYIANGRVVFSHGYGVSSAETRTPVTPDMLFRVGSLTKVVTALAVVAEARTRHIPLNAPIGRYLRSLHPAVGRVTLAQLLSHTAGIREEITATPIVDRPDPDELVKDVKTWNQSVFFTTPGEVESYTNLGYVLAGAFVEAVSKRRFADIVTERVLTPLGISDATFSPGMAATHAFSQGHVGAPGDSPTVVRPIRVDARHLPPTFLWASALDLARLEIALMNNGRLDGRQALDSSDVALVTSPHAATPVGGGESYAYGLYVRDGGTVRRINHGGRLEGYFGALDMVPSLGRGFIALSNRLDITPAKTIAALGALELAGVSARPVASESTSSHEGSVDDLVGHYVNGDWSLVISRGDSGVVLRGRVSPTRFAPVVASVRLAGPNVMLATYRGTAGDHESTARFAIARDRAGRVQYLYLGGRALRRQP